MVPFTPTATPTVAIATLVYVFMTSRDVLTFAMAVMMAALVAMVISRCLFMSDLEWFVMEVVREEETRFSSGSLFSSVKISSSDCSK